MPRNLIPTQIIPSGGPDDRTPRQIAREFNDLLKTGARIHVAGSARNDPRSLLSHQRFSTQLRPRHKIALFETQFYLTAVHQIPELRFFVAWVVQDHPRTHRPEIFPRIFYKDLSLAWRSASHFTITNGDIWVGKGDVKIGLDGDYETVESNESTTDLPLEMQTAIESLLSLPGRSFDGDGVLDLILRRAPDDRIKPYRDFIAPRQRAASIEGNLINKGKSIARFKRKNDPQSIAITKGYAPDFKSGVIETSTSNSKLYGGLLRRFRILSTNKKIQYYFIAGAKHVWIYPPPGNDDSTVKLWRPNHRR